MKTEWTWDEALEDGTDLANELIGTTRWGTRHRRVFEFEHTTYAVEYRRVPEEGIDDDDPPEVYEVGARYVTITKWERV